MIYQLETRRREMWIVLVSALILSVWQSAGDSFAATQCLICHPLLAPKTEIQVTEWKSSKHAKSLETLKASPDAKDACLKCHSADYVFDKNITLDKAESNNDCAVCHADHKGLEKAFSGIGRNLLKPKGELCNGCHSASGTIPGDKPRATQVEIFTGTGGAGVSDFPGIHYTLMKDKDGCATCHMFKEKEEEVSKVGGHTFEANTAACLKCHTDPAVAEKKKADAQKQISDQLAELKPLLETYADKESEDFKNAEYDINLVETSGDLGVHNLTYSKNLLDYSASVLKGGEKPKAEETCLVCHKALTVAQVTGWEQSKHAKSLETLLASKDAKDECLQCHSVDYRNDPTLTLQTAQLPNGCGSCHADHKGTEKAFSGIGKNLLKPKNEICIDCHTAGDAKPGETLRAAQREIFMGTGGVGVKDSPGIHSVIMKDGCVYCHTPSMKDEKGNDIVHTFEANMAVCSTCHADPTAKLKQAKEDITAKLTELTKSLEEYPDKKSDNFKNAKFNADLVALGESGAHNPTYSRSLLEYSTSLLKPLAGLPAYDVNQDGIVDISDLVIVGLHFGEEIADSPEPNPDVSRDGTVDISDLVLIGLHFGEITAPPAAPEIADSVSTSSIWLELKSGSDKNSNWMTVYVKGDFSEDIHGYQFDMEFDPNLLELIDLQQGAVFSADSKDIYWHPGQVNRSAGMLSNVAGVVLNSNGLATNGDMTLASLTFVLKRDDTPLQSSLQLKNVKLADKNARLMPYTLRPPMSFIVRRIPQESRLFQNYPNPFNPETWIPYQLSEEANVKVNIYDASGKLIRTIDLGHRQAGVYLDKNTAASWNGRTDSGEQVASGVYFYQFQAGKFRKTRKMILVK